MVVVVMGGHFAGPGRGGLVPGAFTWMEFGGGGHPKLQATRNRMNRLAALCCQAVQTLSVWEALLEALRQPCINPQPRCFLMTAIPMPGPDSFCTHLDGGCIPARLSSHRLSRECSDMS